MTDMPEHPTHWICTRCGTLMRGYHEQVGYDGPVERADPSCGLPLDWEILCKPCAARRDTEHRAELVATLLDRIRAP